MSAYFRALTLIPLHAQSPEMPPRAVWSGFFRAIFCWAACFTAPAATVQVDPPKQAVAYGDSAIFTAVPGQPGSYDYQWFFNNSRLIGQTRSQLRVYNVTTAQQGFDWVLLREDRGETAEGQAALTVFLRPLLFQNGGRR